MGRARKKSPAAVAMGRKGGTARWKGTTKTDRSEILRRVAEARWKKRREM